MGYMAYHQTIWKLLWELLSKMSRENLWMQDSRQMVSMSTLGLISGTIDGREENDESVKHLKVQDIQQMLVLNNRKSEKILESALEKLKK